MKTQYDKDILEKIALAVRSLSIDAVEAAGCGHPGLPLGCAEIGAALYGHVMTYNPANPNWINRDRFVLSAGHGSMLLYSLLHLSGYDVSLAEVRNFRQLHSKTPGHPEYRETPGVETTTGPLGQGFATAVGMALGQKITAARLGPEGARLLDGHVYVLASDGCIMEGVTSEASSLAGHLQLDNLIVIYDSNDVCLDGDTKECFSEDTALRYQAYGWHVQTIDGHDMDAVVSSLQKAQETKGRPSLIVAKTVIGKGAPTVQGTSEVHGKALGAEEARLTKEALGIPTDQPFFIPKEVTAFFKNKQAELARTEAEWQARFKTWAVANKDKAVLFEQLKHHTLPADLDEKLRALPVKENLATRSSSSAVIQALHDLVPAVVGGSADLSCSDNTMMKAGGIVKPGDFNARNIKYGVREFAMAAISSGMALYGTALPFCGTFLTFSDYMRNAVRLAALMKLPVIYQFTHDSILLGEDGPTHQPVEHLAALRAMPGLTVIRPADETEVKAAWAIALRRQAPVALILTRQKIASSGLTRYEQVQKGAYVLEAETGSSMDVCLLASGSEVGLALGVAAALKGEGYSVRVVSFPSFELFDEQPKAYRDEVLGHSAGLYCSIEAQSSFGWHKYVGRDGLTISQDSFGLSAPDKDLAEHFGFTINRILDRVKAKLEVRV